METMKFVTVAVAGAITRVVAVRYYYYDAKIDVDVVVIDDSKISSNGNDDFRDGGYGCGDCCGYSCTLLLLRCRDQC